MFSHFFLSRSARTFFGGLLVAVSLLSSAAARGQSVVYSGVQSTIYGPVNGTAPSPVGADSVGDAFFVLRLNGNYHLEKVAAGTTTLTDLNTNLGFNPTSVAVNPAGTQISVIYTGTSRNCPDIQHRSSTYISRATLGGGSVTFTSLPCTFTMTGSADRYSAPSAVTYDSNGNLYIADSTAHVLYAINSGTTPTSALQLNTGSDPIALVITQGGTVDLISDNGATNGAGSVTISQFKANLSGANGTAVTPTSLITGISSDYTSIAIDALGTVYVGDDASGPVQRISSAALVRIDSRFGDGVSGLASDSSGNIYVAGENSSSQILVGKIGQLGAGNFGSVAVGESQSYTYTFTFSAAATVNNIGVVIQGATGFDYQGTGGTCTAQHYDSGSTCTVTVQLTPLYPGLRSGAVVFTQSNGAVLGTEYLQGTGTGANASFNPGVQSTLASNLHNPAGLVSDSAGNLYFALPYSGTVEKISGQNSSSVVSGLDGPGAVAIDGAGNLYVTNAADEVLKITPAGTQTTAASGLNHPAGIAVDGSGTLYIADNGNADLVRAPAGGTAATFASSVNNPTGVAIDSQNNVYVLVNNTEVDKFAADASKTVVLSGLSNAYDLAVDSAADIYISSVGQGTVIESPAGCTTAGCQILLGSGDSGLASVALDGAGNVYTLEVSSQANLSELDRADPPSLTFATTNVGSTSSDSPQQVGLQNVGNISLTAITPGISVGSNFQQVAGSGTPADCTTTFSLEEGASCNLSLSFEPTEGGDITSSVVLTDNSLNEYPNRQTISLSGTAIAIMVSPSSLPAATVGQPYSTTFTASGGTAPYTYTLSAGALPAGLVLSAGGTISGTPTAAGSFSLTLSITDGDSQNVTQGYTLTSNAAVIVLSPSTLPAGTVGIAYTSGVTASGGTPTYTYEVTTGSLPSGVTLGADGSLTGTPTTSGTFEVTVTATDSSTGTGAPFHVSQNYSVAIAKGTPTITWAAPAAISYGTALSGVQLNATANVPGDFVYTPAAGAVLAAGVHTLDTIFTPTDISAYNTQTASVPITVNMAATTLSLASSTANANLSAQVTFTATVQSAASEIATGSVEFLDGTTVLGTSPVDGQGTAIYVTSALTAGTHTITAIYSGNSNFLTSSNSLNQVVTAPAYSIAATPSSLTLAAGQSGTVTLTMTPVGGFTGTVVLGCNGLPNWASCTATPQVLTADGSNTPQTAQLLITTLGPNHGIVNDVSSNAGGRPGDGTRVLTASLFSLPALLLGAFLAWERKKLGTGWKSVLMLLVLVSTMSGMVGCGFSNSIAPLGNSTVTVTATASGTSALYTGPANETANFTLTITR